jgi:hypothetical protein
VQRCHDQSETLDADMRYGLCKDYRSNKTFITTQLFSVLFPDNVAAAAKHAENVMGGHCGGIVHGADDVDDRVVTKTYSNEAAVASAYMRHDTKMRALLAAGDLLCLELHGTEWSSTIRLPSRGEFRTLPLRHMQKVGGKRIFAEIDGHRTLPIYTEMDPTALGSRDDDAFRALGFVTKNMQRENDAILLEKANPPRMLLDTLEVSLMRQLNNAIRIAIAKHATT